MIGRKKITLTSDASGNASGSLSIPSGYVDLVIIENDGTATPTDLWDLTIKTDEGNNIWANTSISNASDLVVAPRIACVDNTNTAITDSFARYPIAGSISLTGANMGASKKAYVTVYWASE